MGVLLSTGSSRFLFPPTLSRSVGFEGRGASQFSAVFLFGAFPLGSTGRVLFSPSGNSLSAGAFEKTHASTMTYTGREEDEHPQLQSGSVAQGASEGAVQAFCSHRKPSLGHRSSLEPADVDFARAQTTAWTRPGPPPEGDARRRARRRGFCGRRHTLRIYEDAPQRVSLVARGSG